MKRTLFAALLFVLGLAGWRARLTAPDPTFLLRDRHGRFLAEVGATAGDEFGYWPVAKLPQRVVLATIAIEDQRFHSHSGVDPTAVARAVVVNLRSRRRLSGASTLAMQIARMQHPGRRTYPRKALEALTALLMTVFHGRDAVLAHYLRVVPYGNRVHGIAYAARRYLDKPVEDLSWAEIAFLTSIPQSPARMNPFLPLGRARAVDRGRRILDRLLDRRVLSDEEHELARRQIAELVVPPPGERPRDALHAILRLERALQSEPLRIKHCAQPVVTTSLDLDVQNEASWIVSQAVERWRPRGAGNAAVVVLARRTNEVLAWIGSSDYFDAAHAGAIDYTGILRSPGSALKPFLYALAIERGSITPASILDDIERGAGGITNADDRFLGPLLPRTALANSRNVTAANLLARVGVDEGYAFLREVGLHDAEEPARRYGLGLSIGGMPVTLERLVRAYTLFSREGRLGDLIWFREQSPAEQRRLLSEDSTRQIALYLSDPLARLPSFARMGALEYPFPVAVKTGTSSCYRDAWTVAFSTRYVVGVWVGDPDFRPMNRLGGYRSAAEIARSLLLELHGDQTQGLDDLSFPPPRGFIPIRLCALTGARATSACDRVIVEWFRPGTEPVDHCRAHVRMTVDTRSGRLATAHTPHDFKEERAFVDLPPRYAAWAAAAGLPRPPTTIPWNDAGRSHDAPSLASMATPRISITAPENGIRILLDPETPPEAATLALRAVVDPPVPQIVWHVDGRPFEVVDYPYVTRWRLAPGEHVFVARLPHARASSSSISVSVE
ncbi:MAG: transglycosylase domain-containing protein [Vicinamibacteria bacterium]|nr:transglycosylase domain-containing protein [Vicinamibacteria bacterium]